MNQYIGNIPVAVCAAGIGRPLFNLWRVLMEVLETVESSQYEDAKDEDTLRLSFESLTAKHGALISRICFSYAKDADDYKDLRQDVLLNIWKGFHNFRGDSSSLTWIYRVALNTCVSTVRKRSRQPYSERIGSFPIDLPDEEEDESMRERIDILYRLISELSPIDKAIVTMWLDDRSYEEIAEVVGISRNNIGLRLHRIRERWKNSEIIKNQKI